MPVIRWQRTDLGHYPRRRNRVRTSSLHPPGGLMAGAVARKSGGPLPLRCAVRTHYRASRPRTGYCLGYRWLRAASAALPFGAESGRAAYRLPRRILPQNPAGAPGWIYCPPPPISRHAPAIPFTSRGRSRRQAAAVRRSRHWRAQRNTARDFPSCCAHCAPARASPRWRTAVHPSRPEIRS